MEVERMFDLRGKTALVTGASGGIGWAVAKVWRCVAWGWSFRGREAMLGSLASEIVSAGSRAEAAALRMEVDIHPQASRTSAHSTVFSFAKHGLSRGGWRSRGCLICEERRLWLRGASGGIGWAVAKVLALRGVGVGLSGVERHAWVLWLGRIVSAGGRTEAADLRMEADIHPQASRTSEHFDGVSLRSTVCREEDGGRRMFDLRGKTALVTGASRRDWLRCGEGLALRGARVGLSGRREACLGSLASEIVSAGGRAETFRRTCGWEADIHALASRTLEQFGSLDILVNNAGITRDGLAMRM